MIITKTPFRISFFGGGTDYPIWYKRHGGAVLSTTIDKYCYITCRKLPPFFEYKHKISYSKIEKVDTVDKIHHPSVKECFRFLNIKEGLEIHHDADLPAKSGLGSSSSFTCGLLKALYTYRGQIVSKQNLAEAAIFVEQKMIQENVGSQDQFAAAFGGLNKIIFNKDETIKVEPVVISEEKKKELEKHLLFFFTGFQRYSSDIAKKQIEKTPERKNQLKKIHNLVDDGIYLLSRKNDIESFGKLLDTAWKLKRSLTDKITTEYIDKIYEKAINAGAIGGKLIGAGGGGFMVFIAPPKKHKDIKNRLNKLLYVPIKFENKGSQTIYYDN